jgi:hypothetical protein
MPGGDRTGPMGVGGMAGRAAGYCAGFGTPGYANPGFGRGFWCRGSDGGGRGWRNMFYATGLPRWIRFGGLAAPFLYQTPFQKADPEAEKQALQNQAQILKDELNDIEKRLAEIKTGTAE